MGQLGGKDLQALKNLPRTPVGSYIRKATEPKGPVATLEKPDVEAVLERYPGLRLYNPRAWSEWIRYYIKNRIGPRHKFNVYPPAASDRGIYPLFSADGGTKVRVALAGDWGSGTDEARRVGVQMAAAMPDVTIHLGDIYYVGSMQEINEHFLGIDDPHNDYTPCTWPLGAVGSFALNGNHEMYARGDAYYELLLPQMGLWDPRVRQHASFFCLENEHWRVIALDTGYNSVGRPIIENILRPTGRLEDALVGWLRDDVALGSEGDHRGIVLLSHHQYYSAFDEWYLKPAQQLAEFIKRPVLWYWGHEHRMIVYGEHAFGGGIAAHGRCLGHGGMPVDRFNPAKPFRHRECPPLFADNRPFPNDEGIDVGYNGYGVLEFEGAELRAQYCDLTGSVVYRETITVGAGGALDVRPEGLITQI
jgi:hypothetical protein